MENLKRDVLKSFVRELYEAAGASIKSKPQSQREKLMHRTAAAVAMQKEMRNILREIETSDGCVYLLLMTAAKNSDGLFIVGNMRHIQNTVYRQKIIEYIRENSSPALLIGTPEAPLTRDIMVNVAFIAGRDWMPMDSGLAREFIQWAVKWDHAPGLDEMLAQSMFAALSSEDHSNIKLMASEKTAAWMKKNNVWERQK